ncbi:cation transporting ATPase C-terminal domain-containing protein [Gordonia sp. 1D]|uniref:cation transporting ATPase C-terminal domain-containing protein n=1 Tax=Gordonia sp. 1D TaxID=1737359 RepID=UPI001E5E9B69|nr:cation transporting ATPase C-terminal domain-containing protein [Gordonia sp. 1D]
MFSLQTLTNQAIWISLVAVIVLHVAVVNVGFLQDLFDTTSLTATEWLYAVVVASSVLVVEEIRKAVVRAVWRF